MERYAHDRSFCQERVGADGLLQTRSIETTLAAIADGKDPKLPPLMNPTMLEASDDLTNLSHLNEPAGKHAALVPSDRQR
jgi:myosin heavy subunit